MFVLLIVVAALLFVVFLGHILRIGLRSRTFELHPEPAVPRSRTAGGAPRWVSTQSMLWTTVDD
ncbi:MAG: hypothetical protein ABIS86_06070 [Streptosporangiaceae bacterium]